MSLDEHWSDVVDEILSNQKELLFEPIARSRSMPKKIFGGGMRWSESPKRILQEKIAKACQQYPDVRATVGFAYRKSCNPVLSAVSFANMFYDGESSGSDDVLRWLVVRFQPSIAQIAFFYDEIKLDPRLGPALDRVARLEDGVYCEKAPGAGYDASACDNDFDDPIGTLYEFLAFKEPEFRPYLPRLAKVGLLNHEQIAEELLTGPTTEIKDITAAYFFLLGGDTERAFSLIDRQIESTLKKAHLLALKAFHALSLNNAAEALTLLDEVRKFSHKTSVRDYPSWNLLRGIGHDRLSSPIDSAKAFLCETSEGRGQSTYSLKMARRALERAGCTVPAELIALSERQMMAAAERRALTSKLTAWFDRPHHVWTTPLPKETETQHALPKNLSEFKAAVEKYLRMAQEIQKAAIKGDIDQVTSIGLALHELHSDLQKIHNAVNSDFPGLIAISLEKKPTIGDLETVLGERGELESNFRRFVATQLDCLKNELAAELASAGIDPPADLYSADSKESVALLRNRLMPQILQQKTVKAILAGKVKLTAELAPDVIVSSLAVAVEQVSNYSALVKCLRSLLVLQDQLPPSALESIGASLSRRIVMINDRDGAPSMEVLELASLILSGKQLIDLISDINFNHSKLPLSEMTKLYELACATEQPLQDVEILRVAHVLCAGNVTSQEAAAAIEHVGGSSPLYKRLVELLFCENKVDECFYLCSLLVKNKITEIDDALVPGIYVSILNRQLNANPEGIDYEVLYNLDWVGSVEDVVACILVSIRYSLTELLLDLRYVHKKLYEHAQEQFPVLCRISDELFRSESLSCKSWDDMWSDVRKYEEVLEEYMRFSKKESCYTSWPPAGAYLRFFHERLEEVRNSGMTTEAMSESDLIAEAEKQGLPKVGYSALGNMKTFLRSQFDRIDRMQSLLSGRGFPVEQAVEWRPAVLDELSAAKGLPTLSAMAPTIASLERSVA